MIRAPASAAFNLVKQQKVKNQTVSKKVQATARKSRRVRRTYLRRSDFEMQRNAEIGLLRKWADHGPFPISEWHRAAG
jgi:hypothetical protein